MCGGGHDRRSKSITLTSARMPGCSRPRSSSPYTSAGPRVCLFTIVSKGTLPPRVRSRPQYARFQLGMCASQMAPTWAPASLSPLRVIGWRIMSAMYSRLPCE